MSRAQRKKDTEAEAPAAQLERLAFNIRGHAMEDAMKGRKEVEFICAYRQAGQYEKAVSQALQEQEEASQRGEVPNVNEPLFKNDTAYSDREKGEPEAGVKLYLVVGYAPRVVTEDLSRSAPGSKKQQAVGNKEPKAADIIRWNAQEPPVLVVTEVLEQQPEGIQLWALIKPKNGLCTPYSISQSVVFYRSEFRDNSTDIRSRGTNWNAKVAFHSVRPGLNAAPLTEKQQRFKRARDPVKLVFDPNISLCNEIASLAANYYHTKEEWYLKEMQDVLRSIDTDINYRPFVENAGLRVFVEADQPLDSTQSELVVKNFLEMWPGTKHMVAENVKTLHRVLLEEKVHLEYRFLRPFLTEACWVMCEEKVKDEDLGMMVKKTLGTLERMYGPVECTPSISTNEQNALLTTLLAKLKEVRQAGLDAEDKIKAPFGESAFGRTSQDIWARFGETTDTDTARAAWTQELKLVVSGARQKEAGLRGMVEDLIAPLEKLNL